MKIELSVENLERIIAALESEEIRIDEEIKSVDNFTTGTGALMEARVSFITELKEEKEALSELGMHLCEVFDANDQEEETE